MALAVVVLVGRAVVGPTPDAVAERVVIGLAAALTLPGLVRYAASRWPTPFLDLVGRAIVWALAQAVLDLALALVLVAVPVGEWWRSVPAVPVVGALVLALVALLALVGALGVGAIRLATRSDPTHWSLRGAVGSLGVSLVGLVAMAVPYAVLSWGLDLDAPRGIAKIVELSAFAAHVHSGAAAWIWALRVSTVMIDAGLLGVVVLGPVAFWRTVVRPRG